ncbi:TatD family hydrolase [bacterium]|nr:TatD family hydrolase [bacterium]
MIFFDTHVHLEQLVFADDLPAVIKRAETAGIRFMANAATNPDSWEKILAISARFPAILPCVGIHPMDTRDISETDLSQLEQLAESGRFRAISEIGLDPHYPDCPLEIQEKIFRFQLDLALRHNLPICLHIRKLHTRVLAILDEYPLKHWRGIAHCFSGSTELAREFVHRGFLISIAGPATNANASRLQRTIREIPLKNLVIETDSPDLPPRDLQTSRNEPAFVSYIAGAVARIRNEPLVTVAEQLFENSCHFFGVHV